MSLMNELADRTLRGELRAVSRLLTLLERADPSASPAMEQLDPHTGRAYTVGITRAARRWQKHPG